MKQDHLNNYQLMHCHKSITDTLDTVKIACVNEQCKGYFGNFEKEYVHGKVEDEPPSTFTPRRLWMFHQFSPTNNRRHLIDRKICIDYQHVSMGAIP